MTKINPTYVIPVYNEECIIANTIEKIISRYGKNAKVVLIENGSTDNSWKKCLFLSNQYSSNVKVLKSINKGLGYALNIGFKWVVENKFYDENSFVGFVGAELPFEFSDVYQIEKYLQTEQVNNTDIFIGSKGHPQSLLKVSLSRKFISKMFYFLRYYYLNMRCLDPQGTIFIKPSILSELHENIQSTDFFYTTELIFIAELYNKKVIEVPIKMLPQVRPSSVKLLRNTYLGLRHLIFLNRIKKAILSKKYIIL